MKGIILRQHEVQALQAGRLKAIVRIVKPQPVETEYLPAYRSMGYSFPGLKGHWTLDRTDRSDWRADPMNEKLASICPCGQPGETRFVRETWGVGCRPCPHNGSVDGIEYKADCAGLDASDSLPLCVVCPPFADDLSRHAGRGWRSPVIMPEWASRYVVAIDSVRVMRAHSVPLDLTSAVAHEVPRDKWEANPWVWLIEVSP